MKSLVNFLKADSFGRDVFFAVIALTSTYFIGKIALELICNFTTSR